jgi:hypothetical protein
MTRASKKVRGNFKCLIGSRREVWNGTCHHTSGGLTKKDLFMTKNGRIVSRAKHFTAKKEKRLVKAGYGAKKGVFGYVKLNGSKKSSGKKSKKSRGKKSKKMRGGYANPAINFSPADYDGQGQGLKESSVDVQLEAGMAGGSRQIGGYSGQHAFSPANFDGKGVGTSGVALQLEAGMAGGRRRRRSHKRHRHRGGDGDFDPEAAAEAEEAQINQL